MWLRMQLIFVENFDSIQLKRIMQRLAVLAYIELLQRTALIRYCSALWKVVLVEDVMQSVVLYLFLDIDHHLKVGQKSSARNCKFQ